MTKEHTVIRRMSPEGRAKLAEWEGRRRTPYNDSAGKLTIGVGHLLTEKEKIQGVLEIQYPGEALPRRVPWRGGISEQDMDLLLVDDLFEAERAVTEAVKVSLTQRQFDSLVSFTFNLGEGALLQSTMLKRLNENRKSRVPAEMKRWNKARDPKTNQLVKVAGLVNRRAAEVEWGQWV